MKSTHESHKSAQRSRSSKLLLSSMTLSAAVLALYAGAEVVQAEETSAEQTAPLVAEQGSPVENRTNPAESSPTENNQAEEANPAQTQAQEEPAQAQNTNEQSKPVAAESAGDGTTELANSYTADKPADQAAVDAAVKSQEYLQKEYQVFPTPQKTTYGDGAVRLDQGVNLVIGENVDIYTRNRLKEVLQKYQISYQTGDQAVAETTNIYLGIHNQANNPALEHQAAAQISKDLFDKIDAYSLVIKNRNISIVGKDTDAVFYGLTTLKHMLNESPLPVLREVTVEDYAHVKNRGFIEGYYGNPWSNEDREELMRFGGELKLNQYFFAPKDDPYHNSQWRELYPDEKLPELRRLARAGNQSKTRYVWTLHPFMHDAFRFDTDEHYQEDLAVLKKKFTQLMDVGVREFGILADDAPSPTGGYESYNRLMKDVTDWLIEKQAQYEGLRKEMIFVPAQYWGNGSEEELQSLNENLPSSSTLTLTGGRIWGEVSTSFLTELKNNITAQGGTYRPVSLWINWPCTDNSKQHLILGGGEKFLHPNVDPALLHGLMLNPMQQSEPSKIALFSAAEYTWNIWESEAKAKEVNDKAFNFVENGSFKDSDTSTAFRELGKHMINQNMDSRVVKLEESVELAPKLSSFLSKLKAGQDVSAERDELAQEFLKLKESAQLYKEAGNKRMNSQIHYWLDNTVDQMTALEFLLQATKDAEAGNPDALWKNYHQGLQLYNQSKGYKFWYVDHYENAELGVQHIRPFITETLNYLAGKVEENLDPSQILTRYISNRTDVTGTVKHATDKDLSTDLYYTKGAKISVGDYVGLSFNKAIKVHSVTFAMGRTGNLKDTFKTAQLQYQDEAGAWHDVDQQGLVGDEQIFSLKNLDLTAKAVRLIATSDKGNIWLGVREIAVNQNLVQDDEVTKPTISISNNIIYKYGTKVGDMTDGSSRTEAMFADANSSGEDKDTTPIGAWVQLALDKVRPIYHIHMMQGEDGTLYDGVIEYSVDGQNWVTLETLEDKQTYDKELDIQARYVRVRNTSKYPGWWRIAEFHVQTARGVLDYIDTNAPELEKARTVESLGDYSLAIPAGAQLKAGQYIGLKLDRIRQLKEVDASGLNPNLSIKYSPNLVEWYDLAANLAEHDIARYIRIVNLTQADQAIGASALHVTSKEIQPSSLVSTTLGIHAYYGNNDVRKLHNFGQLFDNDFSNMVSFADYPSKDGNILMDLGTSRPIRKIRAYIKDTTRNYLRDGKIQVSADGKTWTDVVTVGDGQANAQHDDSLTDGWTHDSKMPGNRYIEGLLAEPVQAKYLRVLFTADYRYRFVDFSEIVINDGEYVKEVNNSVVVSQADELRGHDPMKLVDHQILTSYKPDAESGEFTYRLSEKTKANHVRLISNLASGATATVYARVTDQDYPEDVYAGGVSSHLVKLGTISSSFDTFVLKRNQGHLLDVVVRWENGKPEFYEISTYFYKIAEKVYTDPATGVTVRLIDKDAKENLNLHATDVNEADFQGKSKELDALDYNAYEVHFEKDNATYAIQDEATVSIPIPAGKTVKEVLYLLPTADGITKESLPFTLENGKAVFKVSHFSLYALVFGAKAVTPDRPDQPVVPNTPDRPNQPSNPTNPSQPNPAGPVKHSDSPKVEQSFAVQVHQGKYQKATATAGTYLADKFVAGQSLPSTGQKTDTGVLASLAMMLLAGAGLVFGFKKKEK